MKLFYTSARFLSHFKHSFNKDLKEKAFYEKYTNHNVFCFQIYYVKKYLLKTLFFKKAFYIQKYTQYISFNSYFYVLRYEFRHLCILKLYILYCIFTIWTKTWWFISLCFIHKLPLSLLLFLFKRKWLLDKTLIHIRNKYDFTYFLHLVLKKSSEL